LTKICRKNCRLFLCISVNVAFDRIWTLAVSIERGTGRKDFACISRCRCHTGSRLPFLHQSLTNSDFCFRNSCKQVPLSECASTLWLAHCVKLSRALQYMLKQSVVGDIIISFAQHCFYWNFCKAMFLFWFVSLLLISITFYVYLANIVFSCNLAFKGRMHLTVLGGRLHYDMQLWSHMAGDAPWFWDGFLVIAQFFLFSN